MAIYDQFARLSDDASALFEQVAKQLAQAGELHQLFDLRLLEKRHELGLPLEHQASLDDLPPGARKELEQTYLQACSEVGQLLLEQGEAREAWSYLRPAGEKELVRQWLSHVVLDEQQAEELIALALHEGVDPERGFAWLLAQRGTCDAITELDALSGSLSVNDQTACAAVLVRHLHAELLGNLRGHLQQLERAVPKSDSVVEIIDSYPDLLAEGSSHIDASHLGTTVRFSRSLTEEKLLELAVELAEYGSRLAKDSQYAGQPPFEDLYRTHLLLFRATLGEGVEEAITYFCQQAHEVSTEYYGASAIEVYLILLSRTGKNQAAMDEYARLVPAGASLSGYAPTLLELARHCGGWERYLEICTEREDAVGYAAGVLAQRG